MRVVLDNIRSAFNVGSVMRTCDATSSQMVVVGYTPRPLGETRLLIKKTAINAENVVECLHFDNVNQVLEHFNKEDGYIHIGIELSKSSILAYDLLADFSKREVDLDKLVFWLGNEIHGILEDLQSKFDYNIYLPMEGIKESLNVANTTTAVLYLFKALETKKISKKKL
jgi:23S rRNA (guanosine2251-2'-O)-methyltransferase